jgi:glycosyltransferase involved in cell wall biosynthesis
MDGYLARLREPPPAVHPPFDPPGDGVTVLVPTHTATGATRTRSLRLCLESVLTGAHEPICFVVVDGGLSGSDARRVGELLRATNSPHRIVPAAGRARNAAGARNAGLAYLAGDPALRQPKLLLLDDDTALATGALSTLERILATEPHAVAVCPRVVPVPDLAEAVRTTELDDGGAGSGAVRLAGALGAEGYDLLAVTSHGSLVTGRTVGLLMRQQPVLDWVRANGPLFYEGTPFGTAEDMLGMATLCRLGELWSAAAASVYDQARTTPGSTRMQQFAWGYDHAYLARALRPPAGIHAIEWRDGSWWHRRAHWGPYAGYLVNPAELSFGYRLLSAIAAHADTAERMFGAHAANLRKGTLRLGRILRRWNPETSIPRPDLPPLATRDWNGMRDGLDALLGHLAGNVVGSLDAAPYFLYGARQPAPRSRSTSPTHDRSLQWSTESASLARVS